MIDSSPPWPDCRAEFRMCRIAYAILAVVLGLTMRSPADSLPTPLKVRFELTDGVRLSGEMTDWDADGFDGLFGRRAWVDLKANDIWSLHQRVINPQSAEHWVGLGRVLLLVGDQQPRAEAMAERAFRRALAIDETVGPTIQEARDEASAAVEERKQRAKSAEAAKLNAVSPEGAAWLPDPWPPLNEAEQPGAIRAVKAEAEKIIEQSGVLVTMLETDHVVLYTDAPRTTAARWTVLIEKAIGNSVLVLGDEQRQHFRGIWGKLVVIVFTNQEAFRLAEATSFHQLVPLNAVAIAHPAGPRTFIMAWQHEDTALFDWSLVRETVHAVMHRWRTPKRPPPWANEGVAEFIAAAMLKDSPLAVERRELALKFIRTDAKPGGVLDLKYEDQSFPGPVPSASNVGIGIPVGGLLVELMIRQKPADFLAWLNAVKDGEEWEKALATAYRTPRATLVETFVQYFKVNN